MAEETNKYFKTWRQKNPRTWELTQMRWYFKNRKRIILGQSRPRSSEPDEYDLWAWRDDGVSQNIS